MPSNVQHGPQQTGGRGFASMDDERQRSIASKGGQNVPAEKRSFAQDPSLAAAAGRKGGRNVPADERSFSKDPALASEAGRKGGQASGGNFAADRQRASEMGRIGGQHGQSDPHRAEEDAQTGRDQPGRQGHP